MQISYRTQRILKIVCLLMNVFFILFGLLVIGLGIYMLLYKGDLLGIVFEMRHITVSVIIIIVCGCVIFVFSFIGLCGTVYFNRFILLCYIVVAVLTALLSISAIVMAIVYKKTWYIDEVRQKMRNNLQKFYGVPKHNITEVDTDFITKTWDQVQQMWYCCGVEDNSWGIYRQSQWYNNQPGDPGTKEYTAKMVPVSCCLKSQYGVFIDTTKCQNWQLGPPNVQGTNFNEALLYSGCFVIGRNLLNMVSDGVIGLGVCITVLLLIAAALKLIILLSLRDTVPPSKAMVPQTRVPYFAPVPTYPDPSTYPSSSGYAQDRGSGPQTYANGAYEDKGTYDKIADRGHISTRNSGGYATGGVDHGYNIPISTISTA